MNGSANGRARWTLTPIPGHNGEGETLSWPALFGNANPVEIEVGFGKGMFLLAAATANPNHNFFGIEIIRKYQRYGTTRLAGRKLPNAKTCCGDAKLLFRDVVMPGSVEAVHVYPRPVVEDPAPETTSLHTRVRGTGYSVLRPGGVLHFATDVADYFAIVTGLLKLVPEFIPLPSLLSMPPSTIWTT